jgi:hypothetical protein
VNLQGKFQIKIFFLLFHAVNKTIPFLLLRFLHKQQMPTIATTTTNGITVPKINPSFQLA